MSNKADIAEMQEAQLYQCESCGRNYIVRKCEVRYSSTDQYRHYCVLCQKAFRAQKEKEREERKSLVWKRRKAEDQKIFEKSLTNWNVKELSEICPGEDTLFIIGNGFDLMHGVKSGYDSFRDFLGKRSSLRNWLEQFWTPEDIWADLENGLAHFDMNAMGSRFMVDNWLDTFDAYDEDASVASFYMAAEAAAAPMIEVSEELPKQFRRWIETLTIGTDDRPLKKLFIGGRVLDFNYTEFVEKLYGIPAEDVCYIHGCRKVKRGRLILGHRPDASEQSYELKEKYRKRKPTYRNGLIEAAQEQVFQIVSAGDEELTKDCSTIIKAHEDFFESVRQVRSIVVIGHSMSEVDWDYFRKIALELEAKYSVTWYIGVHGLNDLKNIEALVRELEIEKKNIVLFRTDTIQTAFYAPEVKSLTKKETAERILGESEDKKWRAKICGRLFQIINLTENRVSYEALLTPDAGKAFLTSLERICLSSSKAYIPVLCCFR